MIIDDEITVRRSASVGVGGEEGSRVGGEEGFATTNHFYAPAEHASDEQIVVVDVADSDQVSVGVDDGESAILLAVRAVVLEYFAVPTSSVADLRTLRVRLGEVVDEGPEYGVEFAHLGRLLRLVYVR